MFWRCFASTWFMRKDEVLRELFERLAHMGIEPLGALARTPSLVEYREWGAEAHKEQGDAIASAIEAAIVTATAA